MPAKRPMNGSGFFRLFRGLDRSPRLLPGAEAALDMGDRLEPHLLGGLRGERRTQAPGAEEQVFLVLGKDRFVVRAAGIDPEFKHAARAMEGARDFAVALQFADVADVDQND